MPQNASSKKDRIQFLQQQLITWRAQQQDLRKKVDQARSELRSLGEDPDWKFDLAPRNERIYSMITAGKTLQEVGEEFGIKKERVRQLFKRQEMVLLKKAKQPKRKQ